MSVPEIVETAVTAPYWQALSEGRLDFQRCRACGHGWLPARAQCSACLSDDSEWCPASGKGRIVSWVVYHIAYAPHLAERIPYNVTIVELAEGPRLMTNIIDHPDGQGLGVDAPVELVIETDFERALPRFRLTKV
ncbi:Zn-ribbon domain-containing OB-fold protein [Bradyrhizobium pachyrhizi]|uniref:Zn-ribbon domain-containing OB-fold protein n=1 Tax=Bradyrhizobium pachyrhizi TaxID=280333 RepID=UPI003D3666B6